MPTPTCARLCDRYAHGIVCVSLLDTANDPVVFHKTTRCMHNAQLTPTDEFPVEILVISVLHEHEHMDVVQAQI